MANYISKAEFIVLVKKGWHKAGFWQGAMVRQTSQGCLACAMGAAMLAYYDKETELTDKEVEDFRTYLPFHTRVAYGEGWLVNMGASVVKINDSTPRELEPENTKAIVLKRLQDELPFWDSSGVVSYPEKTV